MVSLEKLVFRYGKRRFFDDLHLSLNEGNIYGLLGKNGAGKTTLLRILSGQLFPSGGTCRVMGKNPGERAPGFLSDVYFVPEEFSVPALTIESYLGLHAPFYPRFNLAEFKNNLEIFGLLGAENMGELSFGNKKKVVLSFGLATGARLVLMDEPTNGLDIPSKAQFRRAVASSLSGERTFLISTHQVRDLGNLIDPIIILDEGEILLNLGLEFLGRRLSIVKEADPPGEGEAVYCESGLGGYTVVRSRAEGEDSLVDLETLFNAAVSNKGFFRSLTDREAAQ